MSISATNRKARFDWSHAISSWLAKEPAIHVYLTGVHPVDGRVKPGHDGLCSLTSSEFWD